MKDSNKNTALIYKNKIDHAMSEPECAMMVFSSGTGGKEKLIMLSEKTINAVIHNYIESLEEENNYSAILSILPLSAIYSTVICLACIGAGKKVVFADPLKMNIKDIINKHKIDLIPAVPILIEKIHQNIFDAINNKKPASKYLIKALMNISGLCRRFLKLNLGRLFFKNIHTAIGANLKTILSGGATLNRQVLIDMYQLGFTIYEGYGLTETAGVIAYRKNDFPSFGTVGTPIDDVEIKISSSQVEKGEILVKTNRVMMGYFEDPETTKQTIVNGWLKTGDIGFFDKKGYLTIAGRVKDIIIFADETKHLPEEIEKYYQGIQGVNEFAIVGIHDSRHSGDIITMVIVNDVNVNQDQIKHFVSEKMKSISPEFHVNKIKFINSLPRNKLGKISRQIIVKNILEGEKNVN